MDLVIDEAFLPATLSADPMTDDEFLALCEEHEDLVFETNAQGELEVMAPAGSLSGDRNAAISAQLYAWAKKDGRGRTYDSSALFTLPNNARRSPDASWILKSRIVQLAPSARGTVWRICPDFVIELRSASDRLRRLEAKMKEYIANGTQLGWLIDPQNDSVTIFRPDREPERLVGIDSLAADSIVDGFVLELAEEIWHPFGG